MEAIDTLAFAKKLKSAGMPEAQAEAFAEAVNEAFRGLMSQGLKRDTVVTSDVVVATVRAPGQRTKLAISSYI